MMNSIKDFKSEKLMTNYDRPLTECGSIDWVAFDSMREDFPICVDHDKEMISFKMMTKPASEGGKGCQLTDLIEVAKHMIEYLNGKFPCRENAMTITKLDEALMWQRAKHDGFLIMDKSISVTL